MARSQAIGGAEGARGRRRRRATGRGRREDSGRRTRRAKTSLIGTPPEAKKRAPPPEPRARASTPRRAARGATATASRTPAATRRRRRPLRAAPPDPCFRMCFRIFRRRKSRRRRPRYARCGDRSTCGARRASPHRVSRRVLATRPRGAGAGARRTPPRSSPPPSRWIQASAARFACTTENGASPGLARDALGRFHLVARGFARYGDRARRRRQGAGPAASHGRARSGRARRRRRREWRRRRRETREEANAHGAGRLRARPPGLLHDISQGLNRLRVQLLHCEASVVANRSVSIWRLQSMDASTTREEIRTVIEALLSPTSGSQASKEKGQRVLRVRVRGSGFSALVGRASADVNFRTTYGAAVVAMQRGGRAPGEARAGQAARGGRAGAPVQRGLAAAGDAAAWLFDRRDQTGGRGRFRIARAPERRRRDFGPNAEHAARQPIQLDVDGERREGSPGVLVAVARERVAEEERVGVFRLGDRLRDARG